MSINPPAGEGTDGRIYYAGNPCGVPARETAARLDFYGNDGYD